VPGGVAQRDDLGMRGGIVPADGLIEPAADDLAAGHDHRPHRHFAGAPSLLRLRQCLAHEPIVRRRQDP
jgi:hypothetical protein